MPGGLLQIAAYGAQDFYLTGNPQISFFKTVYRRYTNFAMEVYRLNPEGNLGLSETDITTYTFDIKRNGDLISDIYFVFTLPPIFSDSGTQFRWIKNIGQNIINKVSIFIGGSLIDETYGEWMDIWNELTLEEGKKKQMNEMLGNVEELYDPANAPGRGGYYPNSNFSDSVIPSIKSRKIRVPLIFWFNRNASLALPLVALQYHPVQINVEIRRIEDLYTVVNIDTDSEKFGTIIKPSKNINNYNLKYSLVNFVDDDTIKTGDGANRTLKNFTIDPYLDINYIFLDSEEMKMFAQSEHRYLIQQVRQNNFKGIVGSSTLQLLTHHPTSYFVIVTKRDDIEKRNDWNNYTNWIDENIPPYTAGFTNLYYEPYKNDILAKERADENNYIYRSTYNILKTINLKLNGTERFSEQEPEFFNRTLPSRYAKRIPKNGILFYNFSVNPFEYQPSGSCNFSRFNSIEFFIETQDVPIPTVLNEYAYKYDINIYTVNYNILRITSGMGSLEFSN